MGIMRFYYQPTISDGAKKIIAESVRVSMACPNGETNQYDTHECIRALYEFEEVYEDDLEILNSIKNDKCDFIEF
jgi:hypothetical protein